MYQKVLSSLVLCTALLFAAWVHAQPSDPTKWKLANSANLIDITVEALKEWKELGIDYVEVGHTTFPDPRMPMEEMIERAKNVKAKLDEAGVGVWSIHITFSRHLDISQFDEAGRQATIDFFSRKIRLAPYLGFKHAVIHPGAEPIRDEDRPARIAHSRASLAILNKVAQEHNVRLAVENLPRTAMGNTAEEILKILDGLDDTIGICFDVNHPLQEKPEEFVARIGRSDRRITTVHMADYDFIDERHWIPGDRRGVIDWVKVVNALSEVGYEGPFLFESAGTPAEKVEAWRTILRKVVESRN